ncbi:regulator, partial [Pseudomonas sp. MPR-R1B]|uniref:PAS domain-containing protein n=1 Tax=Pseudomonas sp. MPR-R1B TaxID=2070678 RepID=UPI000CC1CEA6
SNIFGYQASEVIGKPASIIFTPEDLQRGVDQLELRRALLVGRSVDERWHLKKSGERIWCSGLMMALRDERDQITGLMK